jgi:hypothetical protein
MVLATQETDEEEDEDSEDDDFTRFAASKTKEGARGVKEKAKTKPVKMKPMNTPLFARKAGFVRCNCNVGVPNDSLKYEPLPKVVYNGKVQIQTYFEVCDPLDRARFLDSLENKYHSPEYLYKKRLEDAALFAELLPFVLSHLPYGNCSVAPKVSRSWNYGSNLYKEYVDIRDCVPCQVCVCNRDRVHALVV